MVSKFCAEYCSSLLLPRCILEFITLATKSSGSTALVPTFGTPRSALLTLTLQSQDIREQPSWIDRQKCHQLFLDGRQRLDVADRDRFAYSVVHLRRRA